MSFKAEKLLASYAELEGLSKEQANLCMADDDTAKEIMAVRQDALEKLGIQGNAVVLVRGPDGEEFCPGCRIMKTLQEVLNKYLDLNK